MNLIVFLLTLIVLTTCPFFLISTVFLFRHYRFDFKSCWRFSRWPSSNSHPFRSHFCSSHFFAISEFKSCTILIILSPVSTFIFSKRVKIFVKVNKKFFRASPKSSFSIWCLIFCTICAIRSTAPSVSSPPSKIRSLVSSFSASSKINVGSCVFSTSSSMTTNSLFVHFCQLWHVLFH